MTRIAAMVNPRHLLRDFGNRNRPGLRFVECRASRLRVRRGHAGRKGEDVASFGKVYEDWVTSTFTDVIFRQFGPETTRNCSHRGIDPRVEIRTSAEYLGGDFVFFDRRTGILKCVL